MQTGKRFRAKKGRQSPAAVKILSASGEVFRAPGQRWEEDSTSSIVVEEVGKVEQLIAKLNQADATSETGIPEDRGAELRFGKTSVFRVAIPVAVVFVRIQLIRQQCESRLLLRTRR